MLVLLGGVLAVVFSISELAIGLFTRWVMRGAIRKPMIGGLRGWAIPHMTRGIPGFMIVGAIIALVLGIVAIYAYTRVKGGKVKSGGQAAIMVGIVMLFSTHWLVGVITLVGGILCYVSTPVTSHSVQSQSQTAST